MKSYREIADSVFARRDEYVIAQRKKKQAVTRVTASVGSVALVSLAGIALFKNDAFHETPPVAPPTTATHFPVTEGNPTATSPTATGESTTPSKTTATTSGKTPSTTPSKTESTTPSKTESTTPSKTESTQTTTAPIKMLITGEEPDDAVLDVASFSNKNVYISPYLQKTMESHEGVDAIYAVFVSIPPSIEDSGEEFWASTEELAQCYKELNDVVRTFEEEAKRLNPDYSGNPNYIKVWTDTMRTNYERIQLLVEKRDNLKAQYVSSYVETVLNKRFKALKTLCEKEPIDVKCWENKTINVRYHAYYAELTAEQINTLAKQGGYMFNLVSAEECEKAHSRLIDQ